MAGRRHGAERLRATTGEDGRALLASEAAQRVSGAPRFLPWVCTGGEQAGVVAMRIAAAAPRGSREACPVCSISKPTLLAS